MKKRLLFLFSVLMISCSQRNEGQTNNNQEALQMKTKVSGSGKPLVLVPGGLTGWVSWDPFVPDLSPSKKVIQVQLLNVEYGLEDKPLPKNYSVRTESEALASSLSSLNLTEKADFIGWSFGGLVLLDYALNHPDKIRTLTLIEPPAFWILKNRNQVDAETQKMIDFLSEVPGEDGEVTDDDLAKFLAFAGFLKPGIMAHELPQWNTWLEFKRSLRNNRAVINHTDELERLRNFNASVLLVKGTGSASFLHQIIDGCAMEFPNVQVVEFPAGHAPHIVSKEKFLHAVDSIQLN